MERRIERFKCCGFDCAAVPHPRGYWRGYVEVPHFHPWNGMKGEKAKALKVGVIGGITFAGVPEWDRYGGYWLGFDCLGLGDGLDVDLAEDGAEKEYAEFANEMLEATYGAEPRIWTLDDVQHECMKLAGAVMLEWTAKNPAGKAVL